MAVAQRRGTKSTQRTSTGPGRLRLARGESGAAGAGQPDRPATEPTRPERRGVERSKARGQGVATFVDPDGRLWLTRVTLVDQSDGGLGVRCPVKVTPGASFRCSVGGRVELGSVAHTRGRGGAYRLGLRFAQKLAA